MLRQAYTLQHICFLCLIWARSLVGICGQHALHGPPPVGCGEGVPVGGRAGWDLTAVTLRLHGEVRYDYDYVAMRYEYMTTAIT